MKKLFTFIAFVATITAFAQAPQGFNYQATIRNSSGALIVNQNVYFKFNVMLNSSTSVPVFSETHYTPTDDLGQVNLVIGTGTATTGSFSTINWGTGNYHLGIEINTGSGYVAMGTTQLLSVPYALYATNGITSAQALAINTQAATNSSLVATNSTMQAQITALQAQIDDLQKTQLITIPIGELTNISATSGGRISSAGLGEITARGIVWSTSTNPTIALATKTIDGLGIGTFTSIINGLITSTKYYLRAYATNTKGTSYGNEISFTTNIYGGIGYQIWDIKNLDVTTYSDGTEIPQVSTDNWANLTTGAWCYYDNNPANGAIYGKLYNWYAVAGIYDEASKTETSLRKKLAPTGYHVPSNTEWTQLTDYLGGNAGGKMKETGTMHWDSPNIGATNSSGFTSLPGGYRYSDDCRFFNIGLTGYWWKYSENEPLFVNIVNDDGTFVNNPNPYSKNAGFSVRCIKD